MSKTAQGLVEYCKAQLGKPETWKSVPGYEGLYSVSDKGRVKSHNYHREHREKICSLFNDRDGYEIVNLCKGGVAKQHRVHKLVAAAFIPNPDMLPLINHKDENRNNNCVENLEWCTPKYNTNYGTCREKLQCIHVKPIVQTNVETGETTEWMSASDAARKLNINRRALARAVATGKKYFGSFWEFQKAGEVYG